MRQRRAAGHGGGRRAGDSGQLVAEVGGAVDGHRAGGGFRNGGHVEEFVLIQPPAALDKFLFQQGDHRVAAAEGEQADLEKGKKQRSVPEHCVSWAGPPFSLFYAWAEPASIGQKKRDFVPGGFTIRPKGGMLYP